MVCKTIYIAIYHTKWIKPKRDSPHKKKLKMYKTEYYWDFHIVIRWTNLKETVTLPHRWVFPFERADSSITVDSKQT